MTANTNNIPVPAGAIPLNDFMRRYRLSQKALAALVNKSQPAVRQWVENADVFALETPTGVQLLRIKHIHTLPLPDKASY